MSGKLLAQVFLISKNNFITRYYYFYYIIIVQFFYREELFNLDFNMFSVIEFSFPISNKVLKSLCTTCGAHRMDNVNKHKKDYLISRLMYSLLYYIQIYCNIKLVSLITVIMIIPLEPH